MQGHAMMQKIVTQIGVYKKCTERKCKFESNVQNKVMSHHLQKLEGLRRDFASKKITLDKFTKEVSLLKSGLMNLQETQKLNECAIKKCKNELSDSLDILIDMFNKACSETKDKNFCNTVKDFEHIKTNLKRDKLTHDDMKMMSKRLLALSSIMKKA
jgi:hypothetical protein